MAITADDLAQLQQYTAGVMGRADHHAGAIKGVALALLGGIVWRADPGSIRVRSFAGTPANILWVTISGRNYVLAYNPTNETIEIRDRTGTGARARTVLHAFNDDVDLRAFQACIRGL